MTLSSVDRNKRRALIVRRYAAYLAGKSQRELWRERRETMADELEVHESRPLEDDELIG